MTTHDEPPNCSVCKHCGHQYWQHGSYDAVTRSCPDVADSVFQRRPLKPPHHGQSFTSGQVNWLADVVDVMQSEQGPQQLAALRQLARSECLASIARKVAAMKASSTARKGRAAQ